MRTFLISSLLLIVCGCRSGDKFRGSEIPATPIDDFMLQDHNGGEFKFSDHRGKVMVFFFGFTFCPDVCPLTLSTWKRVHDALEADAQQIEFVYVTVDPQRDTPEKLKTHLAIYSPDFTGLTGGQQALSEVYASFGVFVEKVNIADSPAGYLINHSSRMFVVDRAGSLRLLIDHEAGVDDIVHDLRLMLKMKK
jgi:protein SCO1/2